MSTEFTAYITKYALTQGIYAKPVRDCGNGMVATTLDRYVGYFHEGEWHRSQAAAIAKAEDMRAAAVKAAEKKIAKLKAMRFKVLP